MPSSVGIKHQRMRPVASVSEPSDPDVVCGLFPITENALEGDTVECEVRRIGGSASTQFTVTYQWESTSGSADFADPSQVNGSAVIIGGDTEERLAIRTQVRTGEQGVRQIKCTLLSTTSGTIDNRYTQIQLNLDDVDDEGVPEIPLPAQPKLMPAVAAAKQRCVGWTGPAGATNYPGTNAGLASALNAANPGDKVIIGDVTISGAAVGIGRNGTASATGANHIMICARNHLKAILDCQLDVDGEYVWVSGIKFTYSGTYGAGTGYTKANSSVLVRRKGFWATNNWCTSEAFAFFIYNATKVISNLRISYNDILCSVKAASENMAIFAIDGTWPATVGLPADSDIAYNLVHQVTLPGAAGGDAASRSAFTADMLWPVPAVAVQTTFRVWRNHFDGYYRNEIFSTRHFTLAYNYFKWAAGPVNNICVFRSGLRSGTTWDIGGVIVGNLFDAEDAKDGTIVFNVNGFGATLRCNKVINGAGSINLRAGQSAPPPAVDEPSDGSSYASLIENFGFVVTVGQFHGNNLVDATRGGFPTNVRIYQGDSGWNPTVTLGADKNGAATPASSYTVVTGYGPYNKVNPVTESNILTNAGCDDPDDEEEGAAWPYSGSAQDLGDPLGSTPTVIGPFGTKAAIENAVNNAAPGTTILCSAGTYADCNFTADGTGNLTTGVPTLPIYIKANDPSVDCTINNGVYFSGTVSLRGNWLGIIGRGIRIQRFKIYAPGCRISRCVQRGASNTSRAEVGSGLENGSYRWSRIDRNWVQWINSNWIDGAVKPGDDIKAVRIYRNFAADHEPASADATESIVQVLSDTWGNSYLTVDYNLFLRVLQNNDTGQQEMQTIKTGQVYWRRNTVQDSQCAVTMRETERSEVIENWFTGTPVPTLLVRGDKHLIEGNHGTASVVQIRLSAGNDYLRNADGTKNLGDNRCAPGGSLASTWSGPNKWGISCSVYTNKCRTSQSAVSNTTVKNNTARISLGEKYGEQGVSQFDCQAKNVTLTGNKYTSTKAADYQGDKSHVGTVETGVNANLPIQAVQLTVPNKNSSDVVGPWCP